ncbi:MAG: hypothetical protein WCJ49_00630, partial [Deltaproteobacteria bacterium]
EPFVGIYWYSLLSDANSEQRYWDSATSLWQTATSNAEKNTMMVDFGITTNTGVNTDVRIAYTGSFVGDTKMHGFSAVFKFNDLDAELSLNYSNSFDGMTTISSGDYGAFLGVKVKY